MEKINGFSPLIMPSMPTMKGGFKAGLLRQFELRKTYA